MCNALLHVSGHYPADKIEERITFALIHACLYLAESYDERDDKSASEAHSIHPVAMEDLALHYQPTLFLYWLLPI